MRDYKDLSFMGSEIAYNLVLDSVRADGDVCRNIQKDKAKQTKLSDMLWFNAMCREDSEAASTCRGQHRAIRNVQCDFLCSCK